MSTRKNIPLRELEAILGVDIVAVEVHEGMQGIHLQPGEEMKVSVQVVLRGRPKRRLREDPLDFLDDGNYETGSL